MTEQKTRLTYLRRQPAAPVNTPAQAASIAVLSPATPQAPREPPAPAEEPPSRPALPLPPSPAAEPIAAALEERFWLFPLVQPNPSLALKLQAFARASGIAVALCGLAVLAGWALDLPLLKTIAPDFPSMKANTAISFVLAGGALYALSARQIDQHLHLAARAAAFLVALTAVLTLSEYLYGWEMGIDQFLFTEAPPAGALHPGRMAPAGALIFFLVGVSLLVLDVKRCYPVAQVLTLLGALVALTALIGYAYGVESLYGIGSTNGMALHSSICFLLLSSGILLTRQDHGLLVIITSDAAGGVMARRLLPAAIVIPFALGALTVVGQRVGLHGPEFGVFLVVIWSIVSFSTLTWWNSGSLYRLDTERKRVEEAFKAGEARLADAQRIAHVGSTEWDIVTSTLTWSDEFYRILGYQPQEVEPGYPQLLDRVHPNDRKMVEENIAHSLSTGEPFAFDYRIIRPDGALRMAHGEGNIVHDEDGQPVRLMGTAQDITERMQIEHALRQSEARTRSIIEAANDAFIAIDAAGMITDWNPQAEATFGWTREEAIGRTLAETVLPPELREEHLEGLHRYVISGDGPTLNTRAEMIALHKDGRLFPVEMTVSPIRWGRSHIFSVFVRDITERKQAEEAIARQTAELTRINAELEDFTHSVSHDLKEPLRGIEAFAGFIAEDYGDKLDEQGQRYVGILRESAVRMKDLIDDLLQLSRIGRTRFEHAPVRVRSLVEDVSLELSFALQEKRVDLQVAPRLPTVACDKVRMREVFKNLISNAVKYNDKPNPRIEIACRSENGAFTFSVRDNGIGIALEYHDKIFKIFQRLHHREEYEGTGVGLAICKKVVEAHGGRIWVESVPGQGTTFFFTLPHKTHPGPEQEEHLDGNHAGAV